MFEIIVWSAFFGFGFLLLWPLLLWDNAPDGVVFGSGLIMAVVIASISFNISSQHERKTFIKEIENKNLSTKCDNYILSNFEVD